MATRLAGSPSGSGTSTAPSTRPPRSTTSRRQRSTRTDLASSTTSPTPLCRPRYEPGTDLADEPRQGRQQWVRTRSKSIGSALCRMRDRSLPPADLQRRPIFNVDYELSGAAERYGFDLRWHSGSELAVKDIPVDFRGPAMPEVGRRVARPDGIVDAAAIGRAARLVVLGPPLPGGDPPESELQLLKYLWHTVVAYGHDAVSSAVTPP